VNAAQIKLLSNDLRRKVLRAVQHAGAGHIGGVLSAAEMLIALYFSELRIDPTKPAWEDRDRFILSKGHCSIGLYTAMAMRGFFPVEELDTFDAIDSRLQGHPDMTRLPGLDMSTGSLGQGLSPGVGMALGARIIDKTFMTWVMLGDGEMQEGQIWEAAFVAARYKLDNLIAILDWNRLQQYGWATDAGYKDVARLDPADHPTAKWEAFGWRVIECDGHDVDDFRRACARARASSGKPSIIIAHTIKGKGVSFMEHEYTWHSRPMSEDDLRRALDELDSDDRKSSAAAGPS
jgi:transketolase